MRYEGDGEFVAGAFRSIRAFTPFRKSNPPFTRLSALSYSKEYEIGKEYKAKCEKYYLDPVKVSTKYGVPVLNDLYLSPTMPKRLVEEHHVTIKSRTLSPVELEVSVDEYNALLTKNTHEAPQRGCSCGFYSFYDKNRMFQGSHLYLPIPVMYVYGVIENSGRVVHCEYGLRSEKMKILDVVEYNFNSIDKLIEKFPLDVFEG